MALLSNCLWCTQLQLTVEHILSCSYTALLVISSSAPQQFEDICVDSLQEQRGIFGHHLKVIAYTFTLAINTYDSYLIKK